MSLSGVSGVSGRDEEYRYPDIPDNGSPPARQRRERSKAPMGKVPPVCYPELWLSASASLPPWVSPLSPLSTLGPCGVELKNTVDYQQLFSLVLICFQENKKIFMSCFSGEHVVVCSYLEIFRYRRPATFLLSDLINSVHVKQAWLHCE